MPHRFLTSHILPPESLAMLTLWCANLSGLISDKDWERAIGPYGGLLVSLLMLLVLIRHSAARIKKEDARAEKDAAERERRHKEQLDAMASTHSKFEVLHTRQMDAQLETAKALLKLAHAQETLHSEMRGRPCQVARHLPPMPSPIQGEPQP
jgi:hypothetical protein